MKIAIFGQYYQNDTRPIIRDIFVFFNANNVELVIEEKFLKILYEQEILKRENVFLKLSSFWFQAKSRNYIVQSQTTKCLP